MPDATVRLGATRPWFPVRRRPVADGGGSPRVEENTHIIATFGGHVRNQRFSLHITARCKEERRDRHEGPALWEVNPPLRCQRFGNLFGICLSPRPLT